MSSAPKPAPSPEQVEACMEEAQKALRCLYIEAPSSVAADVGERVNAAFEVQHGQIAKLRAENERLRALVRSQEECKTPQANGRDCGKCDRCRLVWRLA